MSDDNKEGAGMPVAWAATDEHGKVEALGMNPSRRFDTPLYATPPAVMPAAPSDAAELLQLAKKHGAYITGGNPGDTATFRPHELVAFADALSQTMQPQTAPSSTKDREYPPLPEPQYQMGGKGHSNDAMRAYVDEDRAMLKAAPSAAQPGESEGGQAVKKRCVVGSKCDDCTCAEDPRSVAAANGTPAEGMSLSSGAAEIMGNALRDGNRNTRTTPRGHS